MGRKGKKIVEELKKDGLLKIYTKYKLLVNQFNVLWNPNVQFHIHKDSPPILNLINSITCMYNCFFKNYSNILV